MPDDEKRQFIRIPFETRVTIRIDGREILSKQLKNVSLGGAFVCTTESVPEHTMCELNIELKGPASLLVIAVEGEVLRCQEDGIAVKFTRIDLDSLVHLHHLVRIYADDPNLIDLQYTRDLLAIRES